MNSVEQLDSLRRLVRLQLTDEMEGKVSIDILQGRPFRLRLLNPVFAKQ